VFGGFVGEGGERGVVEHEARPGEIGLDGDAQDGVHGHVQDAAVRNHQCARGGGIHQFLQVAPGAQVHFPAAFAGLAETRVGSHELRLGGHLRCFGIAQSGDQAVVDLHPILVGFERHAERGADDLRRFAGAQQRTGEGPVEGDPFGLPAFRQGTRLEAAALGQREVGVSLKTVLQVADRLAVAQESDGVSSGSHRTGILPSEKSSGDKPGCRCKIA